MRTMIRMLAVTIALAFGGVGVGSLAAPQPVHAAAAVLAAVGDVDDFVFDSLDVEYTLTRAADGTSRMRVVETFVAVFPETDQNRGMRRSIPDSYLGSPTFPTLVSVTDETGAPRAAETDSEDGRFVITSRADDFVHGAQTYVFTYDLENVTRAFADTDADELYWNVNGLEWAQPFGSVSVTLTMDAELGDALTGAQACYVGTAGATNRCQISAAGEGGGARIEASTGGVAPYETMTIAVGFAPGTFTPFDSSPLASPFGWLQGMSLLGGIAALVAAIVVRARRLRDDPGRPTIIAEYTPPRGLDALESAVLLGKTAKGIPAEVLEQAIAGSLRVVEGPRKWGSATYELHLVDRSRGDENGRELLDGMFHGGATTYTLGKSDSRLSRTAQKILADAERALKQKGMRRVVPARVRVWPILAAVLAAAGATGFGIAALGAGVFAAVPIVLLIAGALLVFVVAGLLSRRPLTARGAEARDHLRGLELFIDWAEADRIRMLQSPQGAERRPVAVDDQRQVLALYERLLPYAVVFGQEKKWASELAVRYGDSAPGWYYGNAPFHAAAFSASVSSLTSSASTATASSSGGSSGGGSAGGGGGGGGGGGV
jgi:hypothetical protein